MFDDLGVASYTVAQLVRTHVANVIGHTWQVRFERGTYSRAFGTDKPVFDQRLGARQVRVGPPGLDPGEDASEASPELRWGSAAVGAPVGPARAVQCDSS